jgi:hypothetical protein
MAALGHDGPPSAGERVAATINNLPRSKDPNIDNGPPAALAGGPTVDVRAHVPARPTLDGLESK